MGIEKLPVRSIFLVTLVSGQGQSTPQSNLQSRNRKQCTGKQTPSGKGATAEAPPASLASG